MSTEKSLTDCKLCPINIVLDNVRSLHNVGSAFRTADAFGASKIHLCGITGTPPHQKIEKTALGATDSVDWQYYTHTIDAIVAIQQQRWKIVVVEQTQKSIPLQNFAPSLSLDKKYCLVFGNEVTGVDKKVIDKADAIVNIPQQGKKKSLNISVCLGVVAWEVYKNTLRQ